MPSCQYPPSSEEYMDFILHYSPRSLQSFYELAQTHCVNFVSRSFAVIYALQENAAPLNISRYPYSSIPKLFGLLDTSVLESSGVLPVFDQPALHADGQGVILGIIDTGIDYTNPLFLNPDGTSRILSIWDQSIDSEEPPIEINGFQTFYGTVYSQEQINEALNSQTPYELVPSRDTDGHGTFMAGVAAGNRIDRPVAFSGSAPNASLAVVKLKPAKQYLRDFFLVNTKESVFQENDIMAAISFLLSLASQKQLPLVIYLGVGTNQGSHEGKSPLGQQLENLNGYLGLAVVAGAGNEVGYHHHFMGTMSPEQEFEDIELRVGADETGFCMELWAREPELYTVGVVSPSGEVIDRISLNLNAETVISFRLDSTVLTVNYQNYESGSGSQLIFMRFQTPSSGIWRIRVYPTVFISGRFHVWLPMHGFLSDQTIFLRPDPGTTVMDPGNADMPLTVSAYNHGNNSIYIHSSRGYTPGGRIKPDLAAPGVDIQGPAIGTSIEKELSFTHRSGSSVAAAVTAGAVADIFTWGFTNGNDLGLSNTAIASMLIRGADRNPAFTYPNPIWGYGTLNLYQSFLRDRD
ncbi:MAG: S8 family peptidase [Lachnospiraceae bacterium]|jgi:hypothetical protein|nr:S8 family peptidase [Lachnospiraceae bacterium]